MALQMSGTVAFHPGVATRAALRFHDEFSDLSESETAQSGEMLLRSGRRTVQDTIHNQAITARLPSTGRPRIGSPSKRIDRRACSGESPLEKSFQAAS
jgi:hypothetical protein